MTSRGQKLTTLALENVSCENSFDIKSKTNKFIAI